MSFARCRRRLGALGLCVIALGAASLAVAAPGASAKGKEKPAAPDAAARPAETPEDQQAVASGREALKDGANFPWYDRSTDEIRRVDVQPPEEEKVEPLTDRSSGRGMSWTTPLVWIGMTVVLGVLAFLLIRTFLQLRPSSHGAQIEDVTGTEADRVERLPIPVRRPQGDLLDEARRHYLDGNYREAIIYLYSHELVELDKQQVIRLTRGKTNRQYLRELSARQGLRGLLEQTMVVFEDAFFGDLAIGRERFESCWNRLPDFDALVRGSVA